MSKNPWAGVPDTAAARAAVDALVGVPSHEMIPVLGSMLTAALDEIDRLRNPEAENRLLCPMCRTRRPSPVGRRYGSIIVGLSRPDLPRMCAECTAETRLLDADAEFGF